MALKRGFKQLVDEAEAEIETISAGDAKQLVDDENTVIVDLRDIRELWNSGTIPGSVHAPRGMLEFWVDPDSPYHRDVFSSGKNSCSSALPAGAPRLPQSRSRHGCGAVAHIHGGFGAWTSGRPRRGEGKEVKR